MHLFANPLLITPFNVFILKATYLAKEDFQIRLKKYKGDGGTYTLLFITFTNG